MAKYDSFPFGNVVWGCFVALFPVWFCLVMFVFGGVVVLRGLVFCVFAVVKFLVGLFGLGCSVLFRLWFLWWLFIYALVVGCLCRVVDWCC